MDPLNTNPFVVPEIVTGYEAWYQTSGQRADRQEKALLKQLLRTFPAAQSILEVGCGTGHFTRWLGGQGLQAVGMDLSRPMLDQAVSLSAEVYLQADAVALPFVAKSFDLVAMITALEFLPDPISAIAEALRIARDGLILGVINAQSRLGRHYKRQAGPVWQVAHFFTPHELECMIREVAGGRPGIIWRTTLWPLWSGALPLPWGGFIGLVARLR